MSNFATVQDLMDRWKTTLSLEEQNRASVLIEDVSNALRLYAYDRGCDLDAMIAEYEPRGAMAKVVTCDVVKREMCANTDDPAMSQVSQSALGYSMSGTFLTPGGGLFIKNSELKMLGLMKQKIKAVVIYDD